MTTETLRRFRTMFEANEAGVHGPLGAPDAADAAVRLALERAGGQAVAVATGDPVVAALDLAARLEAAGARVLRPGERQWAERLPAAAVGVTGAVAGVAATGTVAVTCGPGAPRAVSLVPPAHVCLVHAADVVDDLGEALARLAAGGMPSGMAWISGPSRSADLEQTLTVGVHGPCSVDVVIVG